MIFLPVPAMAKPLSLKSIFLILKKQQSVERFSKKLTLNLELLHPLRYGENNQVKAASYNFKGSNSPLNKLKQLWGKDLGNDTKGLSGTNLGDIDAGLEAVRQFKDPAAVVIKHHTPCGLALGKDPTEALDRAIKADPESAFGGIIVLNRVFDLGCAKLVQTFKDHKKSNIDIVAAPIISADALALLKTIRRNMNVFEFGEIPLDRFGELDIRLFKNIIYLQEFDDDLTSQLKDWEVVTKVSPKASLATQIQFAWGAVRAVKSNAIVIVDSKTPMTRGIGSGQTSRVRSAKIAVSQAGKLAKGGILASDGFIPFHDTIRLAVKAGVSVIIQPGGSLYDEKAIIEADKLGIAMILTHNRAFRH